jgi:tetratricopeptide (TPR) repeat protein
VRGPGHLPPNAQRGADLSDDAVDLARAYRRLGDLYLQHGDRAATRSRMPRARRRPAVSPSPPAARPWLENGFAGTPDGMTLRAPVLFRLGDLYERAGERQKAIDAYARVVRLWAACDAPLRPAVEDARARLARLTAEPRS